MNTWKRKTLAIAAIILLSVPSAIGVQQALEPTRGVTASWLAAAGFEMVYLSTSLLILSVEVRRYAQRVALVAVTTAIVLNVVADYAQRVPGGLDNGTAFLAKFDWLAMLLSVVECAPLAALAYAMAMLLHRISEEQSRGSEDQVAALEAPIAPSIDRIDAIPVRETETAPIAPSIDRIDDLPIDPIPVEKKGKTECPHCGCDLGSTARVAAASRWGHCVHCKPANGHSVASLSETIVLVNGGAQ